MTDKELMQEVLEAMESLHRTGDTQVFDMCAAPVLIPALRERLAQPAQEPNKEGSPCPEFWDWLPKAYNFDGNGAFTKYNMEVAFLAGKQTSQPAQQEPVCAHGIGKTKCSFCHQPQPEQEPVAWVDDRIHEWPDCFVMQPDPPHTKPLYTTPPQRKPLTDEELKKIWYAMQNIMGWYSFQEISRAIEAAHGIKGEA